MIIGHVNSQAEPIVEISLLIDGKQHKKKAIIDTGFNGYLSIPESFAKRWYFFGYEKYEIATGDIVEQKVYLGEVIWNGKKQQVYTVTSHSEDVLIGTKLLWRNKLLIDFPKRRIVIR